MGMSNVQKEQFCVIAAGLLSPPDPVMADDLKQERLRARLEEWLAEWDAERELLLPFFHKADDNQFLSSLQSEYARLFDQPGDMRISLVESTYKPWTTDTGCSTVFAASKGLLMGDCAAHMQTSECQVTVPCGGDRAHAMARDDEMIFSIPIRKLEDLMFGLRILDEEGRGYTRFAPDMRPEYPLLDVYRRVGALVGLEFDAK